MIEGIGTQGIGINNQLNGLEPQAWSPRARYTEGASGPAAAGALPPPVAAKPIARIELTSLVKDIAGRPPVDEARVADLRAQIAAGSYRLDAGRTADAMLVAR